MPDSSAPGQGLPESLDGLAHQISSRLLSLQFDSLCPSVPSSVCSLSGHFSALYMLLPVPAPQELLS